MNPVLNRLFPHLAALVVFLLLSVAFFYPQLEGKKVEQGDVVQYLGMSQEVREYEEKTGEKSLWTNAMFGGMPTYQINTIKEGNTLRYLENVGRLGFKPPIGQFFIAMVGFYILMIVLGAEPWLALIAAVAFSFTTNNFILYEAGHDTKLKTITYSPLIAAGMILAYRRQLLSGGLLFALGVGLNVMSNHIQMTYYLILTLVILGIAQLVYDIRRGKLMDFLKATGVLLVAGLIGVGASASNLWVTYQYSQDTMRGEPILEKTSDEAQSSSETEGLAWDYAMNWSNGVIDLFASYIPGAAGGGTQETVGPESALYKDLQRKGARLPKELPAPLYWGDLPFTSGPIYFGAVVFFLFFMGLPLVKGPLKWWLALSVLFTFLLSMGKNLESLNRFVFEVFPLYNKFRTPQSILSVTAFLVPLLGFLALHRIASGKAGKQEMMRSLMIGGGVAGAIALFFWLLGPSFFDFRTPGDARYEQAGYSLEALIADRKSLMRSDAFRTLALVALAAGLIWAFIQDRIRKPVLFAGIGLLVLFDLWSVGRRYLSPEAFVPKRDYAANFQPRPVDEQILQDSDPNFRVLDLTVNTYNSTTTSYFHKTIGGYHAAKLQRYQDIIDRHLTQGNQQVLNMLNTKYFIVQGPQGQPQVQSNAGSALGSAWFVDTLLMVDTPNQEIDALDDINTRTTAVVHREFADYVSGLNNGPRPGAIIELTSYAPNALTYQYEAPTERLAVFSETWYGPDKGWQAYLDDQPVEHIRVNYILRGMRVPPGSHTIRFEFDPALYRQGVLASSIFSSIILLGLLGYVGYFGYQRFQKLQNEKPAPKPKPQPEREKPTSTRSQKTRKKGKGKRKK